MTIKTIKAYRTTDGEVHDSKLVASRHQATLDLSALLGAALVDLGLRPDPADALASEICHRAEEVLPLLRTFVDRKPRAFVVPAASVKDEEVA